MRHLLIFFETANSTNVSSTYKAIHKGVYNIHLHEGIHCTTWDVPVGKL